MDMRVDEARDDQRIGEPRHADVGPQFRRDVGPGAGFDDEAVFDDKGAVGEIAFQRRRAVCAGSSSR